MNPYYLCRNIIHFSIALCGLYELNWFTSMSPTVSSGSSLSRKYSTQYRLFKWNSLVSGRNKLWEMNKQYRNKNKVINEMSETYVPSMPLIKWTSSSRFSINLSQCFGIKIPYSKNWSNTRFFIWWAKVFHWTIFNAWRYLFLCK